ncbi:MAG: HAD family hydrolase [Gemmatimonadota bacterium]
MSGEKLCLLLFDVDGTLVHVDGAGREALRAAMLEVYGTTGTIDTFDFHGKTDPAIVRGLLRPLGRGEGWIERGLCRLWKEYCAALERELRLRRDRLGLCPGVAGGLRGVVRQARFTTALVTGNVECGAWHKLRACGLDGQFQFGAFGSDSERRDELPLLAVQRARERTGYPFDPRDAIVIGDTPLDIRCARASGAKSLAVATGRYSVEQLATHAPDAVVGTLADLGRILTDLRA